MSTSQGTQRYTIRAVDRAVRILLAFTGEEAELSVADIAARVDVPRSTAFRILSTLEAGGVVERRDGADTYRLGPSALLIGGAVLRQVDFRQRLHPFLLELLQMTGETVHLVIFREQQAIVVDKIDSPHAIRLVSNIGFRSPLNATAAGKLLLAYQPGHVIDEILAGEAFRAYTANTVTTAAALRERLNAIRRDGYAVDDEEFELGLRCLAAPIRDHTGAVIAGVSISGPTQRMTHTTVASLTPRLLDSTERISRELGYAGPALRSTNPPATEPPNSTPIATANTSPPSAAASSAAISPTC